MQCKADVGSGHAGGLFPQEALVLPQEVEHWSLTTLRTNLSDDKPGELRRMVEGLP
jgi:hypothetical protein